MYILKTFDMDGLQIQNTRLRDESYKKIMFNFVIRMRRKIKYQKIKIIQLKALELELKDSKSKA